MTDSIDRARGWVKEYCHDTPPHGDTNIHVLCYLLRDLLELIPPSRWPSGDWCCERCGPSFEWPHDDCPGPGIPSYAYLNDALQTCEAQIGKLIEEQRRDAR